MPTQKKEEEWYFKTDRDKRWQKCIIAFLEAKNKASSGLCTGRQYKSALKTFFINPDKRPDQMTRADVEAFMQRPGRHGKPLFSTQNWRLLALSSFYHFAQKQSLPGGKKLIKVIPTEDIALVKGEQIDRDIDESDIIALFNVIPRNTPIGLRDRALFLVLFWTARRRTEAVSLLWGDLEQKDGIWFYRCKLKGHFSKDEQAEMPEPAMEAIITYLKSDDRWGHMSPSDPIFINERHISDKARAKPLGTCQVNSRFRYYADIACLPKESVVHSIRHLKAWLDYQETKDLLEVSQRLGHSNTETVERYVKRKKKKYQRDEVSRKQYAKYSF